MFKECVKIKISDSSHLFKDKKAYSGPNEKKLISENNLKN